MSTIVVGIRVIRFESDGFRVVTDGLLVLVQVGISNHPIEVGVQLVRIEPDCLRAIFPGLLVLAQVVVGEPPFAESV